MARQVRLSTILERGFAALDDGDFETAESALTQAQRIDRRHPEVLVLEGELCLVAEELGEAHEAFRAAVAADPASLPARLGLARTLMVMQLEAGDAGAKAEARSLGDEVLTLLAEVPRDSPDYPEALLTRLGVLSGVAGDHPEREALLVRTDELVAELPDFALDAALPVATFDLARALRWLEVAQKDDELRADALHTRGSLLADADRKEEMIAAWTEVWKLDNAPDAPPRPVSVSYDDLEDMAQEALGELPAELRERLRRAAILLDDAPSPDMVAEGVDPRVLGLFSGTPTSEEHSGPPALTHIHLFKNNLERISRDEDELAEQVRITVWHETAHFFGLDEEAVAGLGLE